MRSLPVAPDGGSLEAAARAVVEEDEDERRGDPAGRDGREHPGAAADAERAERARGDEGADVECRLSAGAGRGGDQEEADRAAEAQEARPGRRQR